MKVIELEFDMERWQIPLEFVAKHRADYYKTKKEEDFDYNAEVKFVMEDDYEGIDWFQNNMNLEDFKEVLKVVPKDKKTEQVDWINAEAIIKDD